jgi:hypothetical protein
MKTFFKRRTRSRKGIIAKVLLTALTTTACTYLVTRYLKKHPESIEIKTT